MGLIILLYEYLTAVSIKACRDFNVLGFDMLSIFISFGGVFLFGWRGGCIEYDIENILMVAINCYKPT